MEVGSRSYWKLTVENGVEVTGSWKFEMEVIGSWKLKMEVRSWKLEGEVTGSWSWKLEVGISNFKIENWKLKFEYFFNRNYCA